MSGKISLTKSEPTVSLEKSSGLSGRMRINLNWDQFPDGKPSGWKAMLGISGGIDLDLACLVEMQDGGLGVVQALGDTFGSFDYPPYIMLDQDDRTGQSTDGENLFLNLDNFDKIKRILVFTFIYSGAASWSKAKGVVTIHPPSGSPIEVVLDEHANGFPMCAIAMITNDNGQVRITREIKYVEGHVQLDKKYGWGLRWVAGSK